MTNVTAVISMLHEPASPNSAARLFRQQPVLAWTLQRLGLSKRIGSLAVLCWEDQVQDVAPLAGERDTHVLAKGPRVSITTVDSISAARRWADGWRGGLLSTCDFDRGFYGPWVAEIIEKLSSEAVILVDPAAGLVDPRIIDAIIEHAESHENVELCFTPAAPGLAGTLLRPALVSRLAAAKTHPGRLLCYLPDQPMRDPIGGDGCVSVPVALTRTIRSFRLDSDRQIQRLTNAATDLNGELVGSDAEELVHRLTWTAEVDALPREIVLELNTNRVTSPIFWPGKHLKVDRVAIKIGHFKEIIKQVSVADDLRLTLAGMGDPLLHPDFFEMIRLAKESGIRAIHVETDLLPDNEQVIQTLAQSEIDVVSVHFPAITPATYAAVMGVDRFGELMENVRRFITYRQQRGSGVPILAPLFTKCPANIAEMEIWYDQWLKALGSVVVNEPGSFAGLIPECGVADMSPPKRRPCARLWSRLSILSNGLAVSCEQDVLGRQIVGDTCQHTIQEIWQDGLRQLRLAHHEGHWDARPACAACHEWHRP